MKYWDVLPHKRFVYKGHWFQKLQNHDSVYVYFDDRIKIDDDEEVEPFERANFKQQEKIFLSKNKPLLNKADIPLEVAKLDNGLKQNCQLKFDF